MSRLSGALAAARVLAGGLGLVAVGAAAGLAAERRTVGRRAHVDDPYHGEDFGSAGSPALAVEAADGVQLHVEVDEPERRPVAPRLTIVLSHGYSLNLDSWWFQRRALAGLGRLVLWDQRSHGRSGRSAPDRVNIAQLGRDLARVIEVVAPEGPLVLVGHSMGGMTMMALAGQQPELVRERVVGAGFVCTSAGGLDRSTFGVPGPVGRLLHLVGPAVVAALARQPALVERGRRAGSDLGYLLTSAYSFASAGVPPSVVDLVAEMNAATPIEVIAQFLPIFDRYDERAALPVFSGAESLVVGAVQDRLTPVEHAREIAAALPAADYVELEPCGHMSMLEYPEVVSDALRRLVDRAAGTTGGAAGTIGEAAGPIGAAALGDPARARG